MFVVTGGAGFIGSNLVIDLKKAYPSTEIAIVDFFGCDDKYRNLLHHQFDYFVHPNELINFLTTHKSSITAIFHMGAISATTEKDVDLILSSNLDLSQKLWHWCSQNTTPFIYASSAATYGDGEHGYRDTEELDYLQKLTPLNAYGWSKHLFDIWAIKQAQSKNKPPQWVGLKFFNVYGPNELHKGEQMSLVSKRYADVSAGNEVPLFKSHKEGIKDGEQRRDFVYVLDCTKVMLWLHEHPNISGLFNCGSGNAQTFNELIYALCDQYEQPHSLIQYIAMPKILQGKYQYFTKAEMSKLQSAGYEKPFMNVHEGVLDYVNHYLKQAIYR